MKSKIDGDRGVTIRRDRKTGVEVFMYKDTPGVFMNAYGQEVSPKLAKIAGFPVDVLVKEREKREAMTSAMAKIEREFASTQTKRVVKEEAGYKLMDHGMGRFSVLGPDDTKMHDARSFLTQAEAKMLFKEFTGAGEATEAVEAGPDSPESPVPVVYRPDLDDEAEEKEKSNG